MTTTRPAQQAGGDAAPVPPTPLRPHAGRGVLLLVVASLCFGSSGVIGKPAMTAGLGPEQVAAARIGIAALVMLTCVALLRPSLLRVRRAQWRLLVAYGLLGVAGVQLLYFVAASRIPVGVAILLEFTSPVLVALWVRFVRRVRLPWPMWLGIACALTGLAMVARIGGGITLDAIGLLAGAGAAVCSAAYFLLGERGVAEQHPLGMVTWGMTVGGVAMCVVAPPWTWPGDVVTAPAELGPWQPPVWVLLIAVALLSTVLAYSSGTASLRHLPAAAASVLALMEPLIATGLAWLLLGEALTWTQVLGAAILLGGAALVQLTSPKKQPVGEPLPVAD
ncbi:drug/metabolite transporter (DMT)-like permease [Prauserella isguenensis]|uniref:Drug/metabolite transporter (DMT)-like permease n=1 Tax=Prauserella isguenensis TaxID=1470180 RepID=A0A839RZT8_9PSEU|nr:EamA family transporter [Prauserella isguenensis]MBB3051331.1 drug/metabolite transporter (DMT)-like permease [Prauserella isguenensis]